VPDAVEMSAPLAAAAGRELSARIAPFRAPVDRNLWFQLVQNLIENAIGHGGGTIAVDFDAQGTLTVRDHGPGVPAESLPRLGERFFRADPARSAPGSGIGLALARAIAEHHGARLRFENAHPGLRAIVSF
jgi:signal transduction histidine kinase